MAALDDYLIDTVKNSWVAVSQATAAITTATRAAQPGMHNVVCKVDASYETSTQSGELTVLFGTNVIARKTIHGSGAIDFGWKGYQNPTPNQLIEAKLAAGAAGIDGDVTVIGYTTGPSA